MNTKNTIAAMHSKHKEWLSKLLFYIDEMKIMKHRLNEIVLKYNSNEMMMQVEYFKNQFKIQLEQINILHHEISKHENELIDEANKNPVAIDHKNMRNHSENDESILRFEQIFAELRKKLMSFLIKLM
jgi:hypothetical protein